MHSGNEKDFLVLYVAFEIELRADSSLSSFYSLSSLWMHLSLSWFHPRVTKQ